jgi:hypothetical protein
MPSFLMWRCSALVTTVFTEECVNSMLRVERISELGKLLAKIAV